MRYVVASLLVSACVVAPIMDSEESGTGEEHATSGATTTTAGPAVSTDASASSASSTTAADTGTSTTTGATTGEAECPPFLRGEECDDDEDCAVEGDCCSCDAFNQHMSSPSNCGGSCEQDVCMALGVTKAICNQGGCAAVGLGCDASTVVCDAIPPACDPGSLPRVTLGCWAGDCIPAEHCRGVTSCADCPPGFLCATMQAAGCERHDCAAPYAECEGLSPCECYDSTCEPPTPTCTDVDGGLVCS